MDYREFESLQRLMSREFVVKLIYCKNCHDIVRLFYEERCCKCGACHGKYLDELNAEINGSAIPIGFDNIDFVHAVCHQPKAGDGELFTAFVIPKKCSTISVL